MFDFEMQRMWEFSYPFKILYNFNYIFTQNNFVQITNDAVGL